MNEEKALIKLMADLLEYYKRQARILAILVVCVLVMEMSTIGAFLYYEAHMETTTTTTTTTQQSVDGDEGSIVNGDQYNDDSQNRSVQ